MYLYMNLCIYVWLWISMHVCMFVCMCVYICVYMWVCKYLRIYVCMNVCMYESYVWKTNDQNMFKTDAGLRNWQHLGDEIIKVLN